MTRRRPPLVAVFLGTDHHRFDRLLTWAGRLQEQDTFLFQVQHGATPLPSGLTGTPLLDPAALAELLDRADAVVTHGGPGSIMDAREHGHLPVVVARDPRLGEHVDDHQQRFARFLARTGLIVTAYDEPELAARLSLAVLTGRGIRTTHRASSTLARFEALADELVHR
ncbi:glycosyltransferase [Nocardioides sp. LHD-245]|uniref:glycosyltransferase n=1 Tax=Nocardioides sp. LHD-245 TaxID=3051387 RepID=UPI0027DF3F79|nr:glycosyltransferase [Nocardioides sp. LHD-245]